MNSHFWRVWSRHHFPGTGWGQRLIPAPVNSKVLAVVYDALLREKQFEASYKAKDAPRATTYRVHPLVWSFATKSSIWFAPSKITIPSGIWPCIGSGRRLSPRKSAIYLTVSIWMSLSERASSATRLKKSRSNWKQCSTNQPPLISLRRR